MAQPQRQAHFFCRPDGIAIPKAPPLKRSERNKIFYRDGGICEICGQNVGICRLPRWNSPPVGAADHIIPRSRGGQNEESNLRLLCGRCNASKGSKTDVEWKT